MVLLLFNHKKDYNPLLMKQSKEYVINLPLQEVQENLTNLIRFGELHPLIRKVIPIKNTASKHPKYQVPEYPFAWLPIPIKYYAILIPQENGVDYDIEGLPLI